MNDNMKLREHVAAMLFKSRNQHDFVGLHGWVVAVKSDAKTGLVTQLIEGPNAVTDAGDIYYAQRGAAETPTNFTSGATFDGIMELYNGASAAPAKDNDRSDLVGPVSGSAKAMDGTYPQTDDQDSDNTGANTDAVTYRVSYAAGEANAAGIADVIITNPSPGASEALLMHAEFGAAFEKTSSDTLKVFVNHLMNGAL